MNTASFAGIPVIASEFVPQGEVWLFEKGEKRTVIAHEGPQAGEAVDVWIKKPQVVRMFNFNPFDPGNHIETPLPNLQEAACTVQAWRQGESTQRSRYLPAVLQESGG